MDTINELTVHVRGVTLVKDEEPVLERPKVIVIKGACGRTVILSADSSEEKIEKHRTKMAYDLGRSGCMNTNTYVYKYPVI